MTRLRRSLSVRIALLVLGLLIVVGVGLSWMSYRAVRRQTSVAFRERLASLATQLAESGALAPREAMARLTRLAADSALVPALAPGADREQRARARAILTDNVPADHRSFLALIPASGGEPLTAGPPDSASWIGPIPDPLPLANRVGPMGRLDDVASYQETRVAVRRDSTPLGVLVQRTRTVLSQGRAKAVEELLGAATRYVAGDPTSGVWSDLTRFIPSPPAEALAADTVSAFGWDGTRYLGISSRIAGTPYMLLLLSPEATVMAPASAYLRRAVLFGLVALGLGGIGAFLVGRWIGRPIEAIAQSAERLASGGGWTRADEDAPGQVGQLARAFNVMVDQMQHTTRHLVESEERYRLLAENGRDIVSLRNSEGRALYLSPSAVATLGYSTEELVATSIDKWVHPEDLELMQRARAEVSRGDGPGVAGATYRVQRADGEWLWVETLYRSMPVVGGAAPEILASSRDITQRKQLEGQVLQAQKLEAIGRLAGGVAHDFNNLLTAIVGGVEATQATLPASHEGHLYLGEVSFASERAAALTRQLLTFSRQQVVQPVLLDLNLVLMDLDRLLRRVIGEDIELQTNVSDGLPLVRADPGQVGQVLMNLAVNARDAMPDGGRLTIETRAVELDAEYATRHKGVVPGEYVLLSVSDTGTGIPPEVAAHLFEPFFTTKEPGRGTGLGLATSFAIVTKAGGHLWYYTEPGAGTTFKAYLPRASGTTREAPRQLPAAEARGTETVLVVEDDESVRTPTARMLRSMGYTVLEAPDGAVALAMVIDGGARVSLVISDMVMPRMGGAELMRRLHALDPTLRVLFLSGYTQDALTTEGVITDEVRFLQKPYTRGELLRAVRAALDE